MSVCPICQHDTKPFCDMCGYEPEALVNQRGEGIEQVEILLAELKEAAKNTETLLDKMISEEWKTDPVRAATRRAEAGRCLVRDELGGRCALYFGHADYHRFDKPVSR